MNQLGVNLKNLAIIPARSGSKGLKDKNIKLLHGKPLIAHTINAALYSGIFDEVVVSTDSLEYSKIALSYGAKVPYLRPRALASDEAKSWDVVKDLIKSYEDKNIFFDKITLLQPTSPLRDEKDIISADQFFDQKKAEFVVSVNQVDFHPKWANTLPKNLSFKNFLDKSIINVPRQKLVKHYRINGAIYIINKSLLMSGENYYESKSFAYIMDKAKSIDIDDEIDFWLAETILEKKSLGLL
jgi:CMP-N,N'-diacetyllegionaminic acid synthase